MLNLEWYVLNLNCLKRKILYEEGNLTNS